MPITPRALYSGSTLCEFRAPPDSQRMLTLSLKKLDSAKVRGIYTIGGTPNRMPDRALFLHPDAAEAFEHIAPWIVVSDVFRTPESSLNAVREGRGAQPPGYSAHNYGLAIDPALEDGKHGKGSLSRLGDFNGWGRPATKAEMDAEMESHGWFCHRRDHTLGFEAWHFNYLGVGAKPAGSITSDEIEARIIEIYGAQLAPDIRECQRLLAKIGLYGGEDDGIAGPLTRTSARAFERTWGLDVDGVLDPRTRRTLAYVACERSVVAPTGPLPLAIS